jgi:hypothetical protein
MGYLYEACDEISDFCHQQLLSKMRRKISWTDGRTEGRTDGKTDRGKTVYPLLIFIHIEDICTFFVTFFSATIDDRDLIFSHRTEGRTDGKTDRGKTVYPLPLRGAGV